MYETILVPTDGSDESRETIGHALTIADQNDATVHGLYVIDTRITAAASEETRPELERTLEAEGELAVQSVADEATDRGLESETVIRNGTPSKAILDYATDTDADLIVIGTTGKSAREKVTSLGSVSERVVDNASIPVLVVRNAGQGNA